MRLERQRRGRSLQPRAQVSRQGLADVGPLQTTPAGLIADGLDDGFGGLDPEIGLDQDRFQLVQRQGPELRGP